MTCLVPLEHGDADLPPPFLGGTDRLPPGSPAAQYARAVPGPPGDPFLQRDVLRMLHAAPRDERAAAFARWWAADVAPPLLWTARLAPPVHAALRGLGLHAPLHEGGDPTSWLETFTAARRIVLEVGGTVPVRSLPPEQARVMRRARMLAFRTGAAAKPRPTSHEERLREWLVAAAPWSRFSPDVDAHWRARAEQVHDLALRRTSPETGSSLYRWVVTQRQRYGASTLEPERVAALERIPGWRWSVYRGARAARRAA